MLSLTVTQKNRIKKCRKMVHLLNSSSPILAFYSSELNKILSHLVVSSADSKVRTTLHSKQQHMNVLLDSFHLNGHTAGIHPQTQQLETLCTA